MKVSDFDAWLESHEVALHRASEDLKAARGGRAVTCEDCEHRLRTYASPPCSECEVRGSMFEPTIP